MTWIECGRATSETYRNDMGALVYADCPTNKKLQFSCGDSTGAKYTSPAFPSMNLLSEECTEFAGGANSPYDGDYILSIDSSSPRCEKLSLTPFYPFSHDIYMHFGNHFVCKGIPNTQALSGWWFSVSYSKCKQYFSKKNFKWILG